MKNIKIGNHLKDNYLILELEWVLMSETKIMYGVKVINNSKLGTVLRVISRIGDPIKFLKIQYKVSF